jgi:hypothetical protein
VTDGTDRLRDGAAVIVPQQTPAQTGKATATTPEAGGQHGQKRAPRTQ